MIIINNSNDSLPFYLIIKNINVHHFLIYPRPSKQKIELGMRITAFESCTA